MCTAEYPITERPGARIGPYRLMEQSGFGLVFVAEQLEPVKRKVALKIIKPGMDSKQVIARFEAERQALALMDHPNIARVLDAGATESGRPYFVMELVRGIPITEYCDQNQLTPSERLELFLTVCHAIQHAHQKGIIHRDVKPSNVLVTSHDGKPLAKVIDFGVAKAIHTSWCLVWALRERDEKAKALIAETAAREAEIKQSEEKDQALATETKAHAAEKQARDKAMDALRALTDDVVENQMARGTQLTEENKEFLRTIISHFEGFAAVTANDAEGRAIRAEGYRRVGVMRYRLGELKEAKTA
jgi:serine/threonine protein kinase